MEIPLFPLHTVLCPGVALPLHVFEERYRELVARCLTTRGPFGVVLIREGQEVGPTGGLELAQVGTLASIREASRYPDGRYDLLAVGGMRFRLDAVLDDVAPYLVGRATPLPEETGDPELAATLVREVTRRVVEYLRLLRPREGEDEAMPDVGVELEVREDPADSPDEGGPAGVDAGIVRRLVMPDDPATLSYLLLGMVQLDLARKQQLLEANTAVDRLGGLGAALEGEILLLARRLRPFAPDRSLLAVRRN